MKTRAERRDEWKAKSPWEKWGFSNWRDIVILVLALFGAWAYHHDNASLLAVYEDPCAYCPETAQLGRTYGDVLREWRPVPIDNVSLEEDDGRRSII